MRHQEPTVVEAAIRRNCGAGVSPALIALTEEVQPGRPHHNIAPQQLDAIDLVFMRKIHIMQPTGLFL